MTVPPLFRAALGAAWAELAPEVRELHDLDGPARFAGMAEIVRGGTWVARAAGWLAGFPRAGRDVPVTVSMTPDGPAEIWVRDFGGRVFRSLCLPSPRPGHSRERIRPFTFEMALTVADGVLSLDVRRGWLWRLPMPRALLPDSAAREYAEDGLYRFDIAAYAPLGGGLIVRYRGWLRPVAAPRP